MGEKLRSRFKPSADEKPPSATHPNGVSHLRTFSSGSVGSRRLRRKRRAL